MRTKLALCVLALVAGCGPAMTPKEKLLFGTMCAAQWADYETTRKCISAGAIELNPFMSDRPDKQEVALFKLGVTGLIWGLGEIWPDKREGFYTVGIITAGGAAVWNQHNYDTNRP